MRNLKRSSAGHDQASIRNNGILKSSRSNVHDLGLMRSLRSVQKMDVGSNIHSDGLMRSLRSDQMDVSSNVHSDGLMRSLRSIRKSGIMKSLRSLPPMEDAHQDDQQAAYMVDEEDIFKKPLISAFPLSAELRPIRSSLMMRHLYGRLTSMFVYGYF